MLNIAIQAIFLTLTIDNSYPICYTYGRKNIKKTKGLKMKTEKDSSYLVEIAMLIAMICCILFVGYKICEANQPGIRSESVWVPKNSVVIRDEIQLDAVRPEDATVVSIPFDGYKAILSEQTNYVCFGKNAIVYQAIIKDGVLVARVQYSYYNGFLKDDKKGLAFLPEKGKIQWIAERNWFFIILSSLFLGIVGGILLFCVVIAVFSALWNGINGR